MTDGDELLILRLALIGVLLSFALIVAITMRSGIRAPVAAVQRTLVGRSRLILMHPASTGLDTGTSFEVAGEMSIGRDPGSSIVLGDVSISGRHALISANGRGWQLTDLGSMNGTLVNGRAVDGRGVMLRGGEEISVGSVVFRFQR